MASPSVARRAPRNAIDSDDAVMMRAAELATWAQKNARAILIATAVLVVVVAGALYYQIYKGQRADRAASAYLAVQAALPADTLGAVRQLTAFAANYDGTTEAAEARILAAQLLLGKNQAAQAVETVRPVANGSTPVKEQGEGILGAALAAAGKRQEAIDAYTTLAGHARLQYMKQDALTEAAILREQAGEWKAAADLYRQALESTEKGSRDRVLTEMHLAEAEAHAAAPAAK